MSKSNDGNVNLEQLQKLTDLMKLIEKINIEYSNKNIPVYLIPITTENGKVQSYVDYVRDQVWQISEGDVSRFHFMLMNNFPIDNRKFMCGFGTGDPEINVIRDADLELRLLKKELELALEFTSRNNLSLADYTYPPGTLYEGRKIIDIITNKANSLRKVDDTERFTAFLKEIKLDTDTSLRRYLIDIINREGTASSEDINAISSIVAPFLLERLGRYVGNVNTKSSLEHEQAPSRIESFLMELKKKELAKYVMSLRAAPKAYLVPCVNGGKKQSAVDYVRDQAWIIAGKDIQEFNAIISQMNKIIEKEDVFSAGFGTERCEDIPRDMQKELIRIANDFREICLKAKESKLGLDSIKYSSGELHEDKIVFGVLMEKARNINTNTRIDVKVFDKIFEDIEQRYYSLLLADPHVRMLMGFKDGDLTIGEFVRSERRGDVDLPPPPPYPPYFERAVNPVNLPADSALMKSAKEIAEKIAQKIREERVDSSLESSSPSHSSGCKASSRSTSPGR